MNRLAGTFGLCLAALAQGAAQAEEPFRLEAAVGAPDWLTLEGEARIRYESLGGQFRANGEGGDQILALRTLLLAEADAGRVSFGLEMQDSRAYLDDAGTPLSTSIVNPLDVLQAYGRINLDGAFGARHASLKLGRQTLEVGSERVIERVEFANVIFSYTGAYWNSANARGDEFHALLVAPVGRMPGDRNGLAENDLSGDEEQWGRRFWGLHYRRAGALGVKGSWAEAFLYGLDERDTDDVATPNRNYLQPGFRLFAPRASGRIDFDIEGAWRTGSRRQTASASDVTDLKVNATMLYAHAGYTFAHAWRPRIGVEFYHASGDRDPNDNRFDQYERLFGSRRTDLGNTGIFGPLTPANINAPGFRIEIEPSKRFDARLAWKAASLEEPRDRWVIAGVQDASGRSGSFIGHAIDIRTRYWLVPQGLRLEVGASALLAGDFAERAPNASGEGDTVFGYFQFARSL